MSKTIDEILKNKITKGGNEISSQHNGIILKLMKLRNSSRLSQNQLASKSGVSHTTISRIENFMMLPTLKTVLQILNVFGMTLTITPKACIEQDNSNFFAIRNSNDDTDKEETQFISKKRISYEETIVFLRNEMSLSTTCEKNYIGFLDNMFNSYYSFLLNKHVDSRITNNVNRFGKYIQLILLEYYSGQHNLAYELFKEAIESCININLLLREIPNNTILYRCRKKEKENYTERELFHIPYEKRCRVSTQRYSFPGLPCLYLGESKDICMQELKNDSKVVTAKIRYSSTKQKYKMLDLTSLFIDKLKDLSNSCEDEWLQNIPLFLVCSTYIDYKEENAHFKQEYIIPQLLLEYIINETLLKDKIVLGIKYFSVKTNIWDDILNQENEKLKNKCNYVFPARETKKEKGWCDLLESCFEVKEISN